MTASCGPSSAASAAVRSRAVRSVSPWRKTSPRSRIAARAAPRTIADTSAPASARRAATQPPPAPVPNTATLTPRSPPGRFRAAESLRLDVRLSNDRRPARLFPAHDLREAVGRRGPRLGAEPAEALDELGLLQD